MTILRFPLFLPSRAKLNISAESGRKREKGKEGGRERETERSHQYVYQLPDATRRIVEWKQRNAHARQSQRARTSCQRWWRREPGALAVQEVTCTCVHPPVRGWRPKPVVRAPPKRKQHPFAWNPPREICDGSRCSAGESASGKCSIRVMNDRFFTRTPVNLWLFDCFRN